MSETAANEWLTVETRGLLFDMDGVLISSTGSVVRCWQRWCNLYGVPNAAQFQVPHGIRAAEIVRMLKPQWNEAQVAEGLHAIEELELADTADLTVLPGVKALLERLPPERWAVVSSATRRLLIGRLAAAGLPVPARYISGDMVERGKPDPEPYRRGAELGRPPTSASWLRTRHRASALAWPRDAACSLCLGRIQSNSCVRRRGWRVHSKRSR